MLYIFQQSSTSVPADQSIQAILGFFGIILSGGSVIGVAVNKIFDAKNIKIMVELQGEIKSLQREAKYKENDLSRLEIENNELREKIAALQEKTNSNFSKQLVDIQKKYQHLATEHQKAITTIKKLKNANNSNTNDGNQT
jgi:predicted RNase H-like nuclease (RuvC/YqgF family)